jgi:hypothetical protein
MRHLLAVSVASFLGASALSAQSVPPNRDPAFCADLNRAIRAAERGRVATLERRPPSFGFTQACAAQGGGWFCHQALAPPSLSFENLTAQVSACLPNASRALASGYREAVFTAGGVRMRIAESGARGAHVGRIVTFSIEPR